MEVKGCSYAPLLPELGTVLIEDSFSGKWTLFLPVLCYALFMACILSSSWESAEVPSGMCTLFFTLQYCSWLSFSHQLYNILHQWVIPVINVPNSTPHYLLSPASTLWQFFLPPPPSSSSSSSSHYYIINIIIIIILLILLCLILLLLLLLQSPLSSPLLQDFIIFFLLLLFLHHHHYFLLLFFFSFFPFIPFRHCIVGSLLQIAGSVIRAVKGPLWQW